MLRKSGNGSKRFHGGEINNRGNINDTAIFTEPPPQYDDHGNLIVRSTRQIASEKRDKRTLAMTRKHLSKASIRKLARRGGCKRVSKLIYDEARSALGDWLRDILEDVATYAEHRMHGYQHNPSVRAVDVVSALKRRGNSIYGFGSSV